MKINLYKFLIFSITIIVIAAVVYFRNVVRPTQVREFYNEEANATRSLKAEQRSEQAFIALEKKPVSIESKVFDEEVSLLNDTLNLLEQKIQIREKYCLKNLNEIIKSDDYIDIKDDMYTDPEEVFTNFSRVLTESMHRPEADALFDTVFKAVESDPKLDPRLLFARIERIDICRDPKALNFVDTVFEAYRIKNWPPSFGSRLTSVTFALLKETTVTNRSVENLLYFSNILLIMSDNNLIPPGYTIELEDLSRRINENHSMFKDFFGNAQTREANYISLSDYLRRNDELSIELRQLTSDIENTSGLSY